MTIATYYYNKQGKPYKGKNPAQLWAKETAYPWVLENRIGGTIVRTRWVGIDMSMGAEPAVFESTVKRGDFTYLTRTYPTMDEAMKGHNKLCKQYDRTSK